MASIISSRQARDLLASTGFLLALMISSCASVNVDMQGTEAASRVDIFIVTTDQTTASEVLRRLQDVENLPAAQPGETPWYRGHLTGVSDGSVYTILVGQADSHDDTTMRAVLRKSTTAWRPRYVLVLGTTAAVAYDAPLGAVGLVILTCDFDLDRFEESGDAGFCHRPDGGLYSSALSIADDWETAATTKANRTGCDPARVLKMAALSGHGAIEPRLVEIATQVSEERHRGLIIEREGIFAVQAVEDLRRAMREPIGFLAIRGVSEVRVPGTRPEDKPEASEPELRLLQESCAARDTADFAVELIRRRWPVSSKAKR